MQDTEGLREALKNQRNALDALDAQVKAVLDSDTAKENETLKKKIEDLNGEVCDLRKKLAGFLEENTRLKNALHDQVYSERLSIIQKAMDKRSVYFKNALTGEENKLDAIESDLRKKLKEMEEALKKYRAENFEGIYKKLYALSGEISQAVHEAEITVRKEAEELSAYGMAEYGRLAAEEIPDEVFEEIGKKSNLEIFIGGNVINKIGVALVIIGVIALSRFTFGRLPDTFKGIVMFAISAAMLAAGELLNRKKPNVFSIGLTGGGVACMFLSLAYSYFLLQILSVYTAVFLCVLITAGAFVLSKRYESPTVASFALIGGYLPISAVSDGPAMLYGALFYFVILNFFSLGISALSKWVVPMFIGFFLNLFGSVYLVFRVADSGLPYKTAAAVAYVLFAFAVYTVIPIVGNIRKKSRFSTSDVVLMGMNTFFSSVMMYGVFLACSLNDFMGLLALIFATVYIVLGFFMEKRGNEGRMTSLFYLTGLAFVILIIPLQFGVKWLAIGWLAEGVLLAVYGILTEDSRLKNPGLAIYALCIFAFLFFDAALGGEMLFYKYLGVTLGSVIILAAFCQRNMFGKLVSFFKICTLLNLWWYCLYLIVNIADHLEGLVRDAALSLDFLIFSAMIAVTLLLSFAYPAIPRVRDSAVKILSSVLSAISIIVFLFLNGTGSLINQARLYEAPIAVSVMAASVLILICVLSIIGLKNALMFFIVEGKSKAEVLPVALSVYFMFVLTQSLVAQYGVSITNAAISLIFIAASVLWVGFGFAKRYAVMRHLGLALSLLAVAKLFLVDLSYLAQGYKIISYFAFGLALLGISFIYQYFSKRLLAGKAEDGEDEGKD